MIRIALPWVMETISTIDRLGYLDENSEKVENFIGLTNAKKTMDNLYIHSVYRPYLRVSSQDANELRKSIQPILDNLSENWDYQVPFWQIAEIKAKANSLSQVLKSELGTIPSFLVSPKGSHDVGVLTEQGETMFPPDTLTKVPETLSDMRDAAKALAFELPTACGFHTFRVLEAVLRSYWNHVSNGAKHPSHKTIGSYAEQLKKCDHGDQKVWETLKQIKDLHRNPLAHPEVILTIEEAIGIVGIARSAIASMLRAMPDQEPSTANPA